jgi:hypothetical protein
MSREPPWSSRRPPKSEAAAVNANPIGAPPSIFHIVVRERGNEFHDVALAQLPANPARRILLSPNEEKTAGLAGGASFEQSRPIHTRVRSSREENLGVPHPFTLL